MIWNGVPRFGTGRLEFGKAELIAWSTSLLLFIFSPSFLLLRRTTISASVMQRLFEYFRLLQTSREHFIYITMDNSLHSSPNLQPSHTRHHLTHWKPSPRCFPNKSFLSSPSHPSFSPPRSLSPPTTNQATQVHDL